jgi:hypothetical protein
VLGCVVAGAALVLLSLATGRAVLLLAGTREWSWAAGAVGLATLVIVAKAAVELPGRATTALVAVVAVGLAGAAVATRAEGPPERWVAAAAAGLAGALALVPYAVNGLFGPIGPGLNDDLGFHYAWAAALDTGQGADPLIDLEAPGYPIGPHALAAALAAVTDIEQAFGALLLTIPVLTTLTALDVLRQGSLAARAGAAALTALPYLVASYYTQAHFKELMLALFALAFTVLLRATGWRNGIPLGLLAVAALLTFSSYALLLLGAIGVAWALAQIALGRAKPGAAAAALGTAAGLVAVGAIAESGRLTALRDGLGSTGLELWPGGNFIGDIAPRQLAGTWLQRDFRFPSEAPLLTDAGVALAAILLAYATVWWWRRRELALPIALATTLAAYAIRRDVDIPYYTTKLLVIAAPLLVVQVAAATLASRQRAVRLAAAVLALLMAYASLHALRGASVGDRERTNELARLRPLVGDGPLLFLPVDHFVLSSLPGVAVSARDPYGFRNTRFIGVRPVFGQPLEAGALPPENLRQFPFVITSGGALPPPGYAPARRTRSFVLWRKGRAATPEREIVDADAWRKDGEKPRLDGLGHALVLPGDTVTQTLDVPPGRHLLALQYKTPTPIDVSAGELRTTLPRSYDPPGDLWPIGVVEGGEVPLAVRLEDDPPGRLPPFGSVGDVAIMPAP